MPVSVVTGATSGIGRWIALGLARAGHTVVAVGRDPKRGAELLAWLTAQHAAAQLEFELADLSLLTATAQAGRRIAARHPAINTLVNNAGVFCTRREETAEGHELVIATNHLSPFVFTRALLPALKAGAGGARIVNVGSSTSEKARIDPDDLESRRRWSMVRAYGQSKLAITIATRGWAARLDGTGVVANVVHPGLVATSIVRAPGVIGLAWRILGRFALTPEQGAQTPLRAALDPQLATTTGVYLTPKGPKRPNPRALRPALAAQVWQATERLVDG